MRAVIVTALIVALLGGQTARGQGWGPCHADRMDVSHEMSRQRQSHRVKQLIRCANRHWRVVGGASKAIDVARCESSLYPWANNGHGDLGVFQISAWHVRARTWLKRRWFRWRWIPKWSNARANVLLAIHWSHHQGWGAWACA